MGTLQPDTKTARSNAARYETEQDGLNALKLSIASTFTSHPVEDALKFWGNTFGYKTTVHFSPYNQVFQELLDPESSLNEPEQDARVVFLRMDDWIRNLPDTGVLSLHSHIIGNIHDLKTYAAMATTFVDTPLFLFIAQNSKKSRIRPENQIYYEQLIKNELSNYTQIHVVTSDDIDKTYGVEDSYDAQKDQLGHIPFKSEYFTALATSLFRNVLASKRAPYKVIVLDCDHTLWSGVCGEVPPEELSLSEPYAYLHSFMLKQKESGKILCLCSKNSEEDVKRVFRERTDLPLREEDIVASKINWQAKSRNLMELSEELNLGLDSFIFVDDNPVECAEVRENCPEVLTLNLPEKPGDFGQFLDHAWVFDTLTTTGEDRKRTQLYKENIQRSGFLEKSSSLKEFIDGLNLEIRITDATPEEIPRVSQLTYRTNQFNFTSVRSSEKEIKELIDKEGFTCRVCRVKDRFAEYGLVGAMLYKVKSDRILLDSFMLSCRVLGRGVEHQMLRSVGQAAKDHGADTVQIQFIETDKNLPARNFLKSVIENCLEEVLLTDNECLAPADTLCELVYEPDNQKNGKASVNGQAGSNGQAKKHPSSSPRGNQGRTFEQIAKELHHPSKIDELLNGQKNATTWNPTDSSQTERGPLQIITEIWENTLEKEGIEPNEHFFDVGGTSLKAVEVLSQLNKRFNKDLTIVSLFEHSTIRLLAELVQRNGETDAPFDRVIKRTESRRNRARRRG